AIGMHFADDLEVQSDSLTELDGDRASDKPLEDILRAIHGDDARQFIGCHHVRYFEKAGVVHVLSRVAAGMALLVPTDELNRIIAGVMGRALAIYPEVRVFAFAFMSNHFHLELEGGVWIPRFMRYVKGQISLRVKDIVGREGPTLWEGEYAAAHLPSERSQLRAFRYILSHGVKEGLVERPEQWPGLHCAKQVFCDAPLVGEWFNGTRYAKARYKELQKPQSERRTLERGDFTERYAALQILERLPALASLDEAAYVNYLSDLHIEIIEEGRAIRAGKSAIGVDAVRATPRRTKFEIPRPPWFQKRRRMIVWEHHEQPDARAYLVRYWRHQIDYRRNATRFLQGELDVVFPPGSHRPCAPVKPLPRRALDPERWAVILGTTATAARLAGVLAA
ncbi:MAG: hypothetical protein AAF654_06040, partial [Myxococcota bacterium]